MRTREELRALHDAAMREAVETDRAHQEGRPGSVKASLAYQLAVHELAQSVTDIGSTSTDLVTNYIHENKRLRDERDALIRAAENVEVVEPDDPRDGLCLVEREQLTKLRAAVAMCKILRTKDKKP